jgi:F-type H+-transporting ATPase subunit gamma
VAKTRKVIKRIRAVGNIRTVTKTMEMVASTRFRRAHVRAVAARPYTDRLAGLVGDLVERCGRDMLRHPLLTEHEDIHRDVLVVITSDTGMCAGYNSSVLSVAIVRYEQLVEAGYEVLLRVAGRRGAGALRFRGLPIDRVLTVGGHQPSFAAAAELAEELMTDFAAGRIGGLEVAYMQYLSSGRQSAVIAQVLPLAYTAPSPTTPGMTAVPYEFVPSPREILDRLLPATVRLRLYQCFLDAAVTEQMARIRAMRSATENADQMLHDLTVRYNRDRQAQITTELAEILGGSTEGD